MLRAIWSGTLSFGLVSIPLKLYPAVRRKTVRFHQLDQRDGARVRNRRVNEHSGAEVPSEQIIKGYQVAPEQWVTVTPDELDALEPQRSRSIQIEAFVRADAIDPVCYDSAYYLAPDSGGVKAYRLLLEALRESQRVALGRMVLRTKEYLVAVRPQAGVLELSTMLFADEIVDPAQLQGLAEVGAEAVSPQERALAQELIGALECDFEHAQYRDHYRQRVLELLECKAQGRQPPAPLTSEAPTTLPELIGALQASLEAVRTVEARQS